MERLDEALRRSPSDVAGLLRAAERVLGLAPDATAALFRLGRIALEEGAASEALPLLQRVAEAMPDHKETQYAVGLVYRRLGNPDEAEVHERRFCSLAQSPALWNDPYMEAVGALRTAIPQTFVETALNCERKGDLACAVESNKQALGIDQGFVPADINLVSVYGKLGDRASTWLTTMHPFCGYRDHSNSITTTEYFC